MSKMRRNDRRRLIIARHCGVLPAAERIASGRLSCSLTLLFRFGRFGATKVYSTIQGARVIKSELVQIVAARNPHLYHRDVENIVNAVLDEITDALAAGNRVELRGFGAFSVKNRPSRSGRNPRTGETVFVEEKWVPFFKTGKELRERLNPGMADEGDE